MYAALPRPIAALVLALSFVLVLGPVGRSAYAHVQTNRGDYFWLGWSYLDDGNPPGNGNRKDPLNFIFLGGGVASNSTVQQHLQDDWPPNSVAQGFGGMQHTLCKSTQRAYWRDDNGQRATSDKQDWQLNTFEPFCYEQYHIRGWDDQEHRNVTTGHGTETWVIGDLHHERVIPKFPCCFTHKINRDWDRVRVEGVKKMAKHCSYRHWRYNPEAHMTWQGYSNYGYIARISMRHVADGCSGA